MTDSLTFISPLTNLVNGKNVFLRNEIRSKNWKNPVAINKRSFPSPWSSLMKEIDDEMTRATVTLSIQFQTSNQYATQR